MEPAIDGLDPLFRALAWQAGRLEWKLHAAQRIIHDSIERLPGDVSEGVILCCRRFGKSFYGTARALMRCLSSPTPVLIRIIGPEVDQTRAIVEYNMVKITDELPALGLAHLVRPIKSEKKFEVGRSAIFLGGYDSQKDNLRGGEAHEILIEETGSSDPDTYDYQMKSVLKPQLLKTRGKMIHLTTLPPVPDHPFTVETIPQAKLDGAFYSYTIFEDPLATPDVIAKAIKDSGGEHTDAFRREYLNVIVRDRNLVIIPDFDAALDVEEVLAPADCFYQVFTDWGGVRDKTVSLLMTYDFLRGVDYVLDEMTWPHNTPTDQVTRQMRDRWGHLPLKDWYADAPGQLLVDLNTKRSGLPIARLPQKDDFEAALNNLANRFTQRKVKIHPQCRLLVETCRSGVLNKQRTDFDRSQSLGHMDAAAALMYGVRCLDRTSPYAAETTGDWQHRPAPKEPARQSLVSVPKSFGVKGNKRFGT